MARRFAENGAIPSNAWVVEVDQEIIEDETSTLWQCLDDTTEIACVIPCGKSIYPDIAWIEHAVRHITEYRYECVKIGGQGVDRARMAPIAILRKGLGRRGSWIENASQAIQDAPAPNPAAFPWPVDRGIMRGRMLADQGQHAKAVEIYTQLMRQYGSVDWFLEQIAQTWLAAGRKGEALQAIKAGLHRRDTLTLRELERLATS